MPIEIAFEGSFAAQGQVSLRTLAQTYTGMQKALERAYMDTTRNGLSKGERISKEEIEATEFYLSEVREGSFISKFRGGTKDLLAAVDKVSSAMLDPYSLAIESADIKHEKILAEVESRKLFTSQKIQTYEELLIERRNNVTRQYGNKSINNYINSSINPVKHGHDSDSIRFRLTGNVSHEFIFDSVVANRFKKAISGEELGPELIFESYIKKMDGKNLRSVIEHTINKKEAILRFLEIEDYNKAISYSTLDREGNPTKPMKFVGYAVMQMGKLDLATGDVIFKRLIE